MPNKELFDGTLIETPNEPASGERLALGSPGVEGSKNITWSYFKTLIQKLTSFVGLSDTPANYTGAARKALFVNSGENGIEFLSYSKNKLWEIYFHELWAEVAILLENNTTITSIVLGNATTVQYSLDGVNWITYTVSTIFPPGTLKWRVSNFGANSDGTIIIKGNE